MNGACDDVVKLPSFSCPLLSKIPASRYKLMAISAGSDEFVELSADADTPGKSFSVSFSRFINGFRPDLEDSDCCICQYNSEQKQRHFCFKNVESF